MNSIESDLLFRMICAFAKKGYGHIDTANICRAKSQIKYALDALMKAGVIKYNYHEANEMIDKIVEEGMLRK